MQLLSRGGGALAVGDERGGAREDERKKKIRIQQMKRNSKMSLSVGLWVGGGRGGTVQLLSRGSDALAVADERGGACPGAVDQ